MIKSLKQDPCVDTFELYFFAIFYPDFLFMKNGFVGACPWLVQVGRELDEICLVDSEFVAEFTHSPSVYIKIWEEEHGNSKLLGLCHQGID